LHNKRSSNGNFLIIVSCFDLKLYDFIFQGIANSK